jgi:Ser/Thr protein kinase RdoA (MazF antagonist)
VALLTPLPLPDAARLGREFGLDVVSIEALSVGSVNSNFALVARDGRRYFARLYEEQGRSGALSEIALVAALSRAGVPVVECLPRLDAGGVGDFQGKAFRGVSVARGRDLVPGSRDRCRVPQARRGTGPRAPDHAARSASE